MSLASHLQNMVIYFCLMSSGLETLFAKGGGLRPQERLASAI